MKELSLGEAMLQKPDLTELFTKLMWITNPTEEQNKAWAKYGTIFGGSISVRSVAEIPWRATGCSMTVILPKGQNFCPLDKMPILKS
jgi:hypothetical protein